MTEPRAIEEQRNIVAGAVCRAAGWVPLSVRYQAADAALAVVLEWQNAEAKS